MEAVRIVTTDQDFLLEIIYIAPAIITSRFMHIIVHVEATRQNKYIQKGRRVASFLLLFIVLIYYSTI